MNDSDKARKTDNTAIIEPVDAIVEVFISQNELVANINITPPKIGGTDSNFISLKKLFLICPKMF